MEYIGTYQESGITFKLFREEDGDGLFYKVSATADREDLVYMEGQPEQWGCDSPWFSRRSQAWKWVIDELKAFYERHPELPEPKRGKERWTT